MAEVKNAFIKSKMNLDLDARLVPQGEYRQGFNIQVSKSEGDDVGALENVLGNALLPQGNFQALNSGATGLQAIGHVVNPANNMVYIFLTNNTGTAYNSGADNFIYAYDTLNQTAIKLVEGLFLNFSTQNPIYGINIVENLLFWTDNRNQPRKININKTLGYYTTEDHISVAKFAPYEAINLYQESSIAGQYETTMKDVVSLAVPKINAADANPPTNPYLQTDTGGNPNYAGDPDYLEDKFVRFSYRFKFEDNEYSALAPFTQECFIPKQDGYFYAEDEDAAFRSTVVSFMENKVNEITLNIPLPKAIDGSAITGATLNNILKVTEIDIIYKESDAQAVQVVDTLSVTNQLFQTTHTGSTISYTYQSLKPYKTLPEADLIRVYDKVPVKAFSQEISGNRVIYGNFQDKHTPLFQDLNGQLTPQLDYEVGAFDKSNFNLAAGTTSKVEYPNSTLKQNRNYQVGIIVSDRYGRSSTVLLSKLLEKATLDPSGNFAASTHYHPYRNDADTPVASWPGDALKILFNSPITTPSPIPAGSGIPGLYIGSGNNYNPLGWYSYKVVVKQFEQDYYNVYLPGILNGPPAGVTDLNDTENEVGFITLINDNINKVPRDLSEVGPDQKQFRSSVILFGRVENTNNPIIPLTDLGSSNKQYYPERFNDVVSTISTVNDLFDYNPKGDDAPRPDYFPQFYDVESNPLIARINTHSKIGQTSITNYDTVSAQVAVSSTTDIILLSNIAGDTSTINPGDKVLGSGFPDDLIIETPGFTDKELVWPISPATLTTEASSISNEIEVSSLGVGASLAITIGDLVIDPASGSATIPAGTVITDIQEASAGVNAKLTLNNTVSISSGINIEIYNPPRIKVNKPVNVFFDQTINVVNDATPGLQYLAVYETEPIESLLDIFWESSTTGLISDLNNAIINASSGAATLSSLNPSPFDEGLANGGEIFAAPFNVLDNFGQIVPISDIQETLSIVNVFDDEGQEVSNYFNLIQISSNNIWNIEITQAYFDTIFYNYAPNTRVFNFLLTATVNGLETDFTIEAILSNVAPTISLPTQGQTFVASPSSDLITTVTARNGSANSNLSSVFNNSDCTIISQTNSAGDDVDFFIIPYEYTVDGNGNAIWSLYNNEQGTLPVDTYYLTIQVQDAGGANDADTVDIIINMGVTVGKVYQKIVVSQGYLEMPGPNMYPPNGSPCYSSTTWNSAIPALAYQYITYFEVTSGPQESQGWYIFNGPFSVKSSIVYFETGGTFTGADVIGQPIGNQNVWRPNGTLLQALADENNILTIDFANKNTNINNLKFAGTEQDVLDEWFYGGGNSSSCRYSQVWPYTTGLSYIRDAEPAACQDTNFNYCVSGMTPIPGNGHGLDISANASEFYLDQYTWSIVT